MDKFNRGVFGMDSIDDLWNTRHGGAPGFSRYWEDLEPTVADPRIKEDQEYKKDAKKESDAAKLKVFTKGGLTNAANEPDDAPDAENAVQFENDHENFEYDAG